MINCWLQYQGEIVSPDTTFIILLRMEFLKVLQSSENSSFLIKYVSKFKLELFFVKFKHWL